MKKQPPRSLLLASVAAAWILWITVAIVFCSLVAKNPIKKDTANATRTAAIEFLETRSMYAKGQHGWLYPVQSAMVFIPYEVIPREIASAIVGKPEVAGEKHKHLYRAISGIAWRLTGIGLLMLGVWRLANMAEAFRCKWGSFAFLGLTLLIAPAAGGAMRNGQTNLHIGAMFILAVLAAQNKRWNATAVWLTLALILKPISIVIFLLVGAIHRPLWWRLAIGIMIYAAMPFLHPNWTFALDQARAGFAKVLEAGSPGAGIFADLGGMLTTLGIDASYKVLTLSRLAAAVATLGLCWLALKKLDAPRAAMAILGLGTSYLMLFNPRTEGNSYLIFGPAVAAFAYWFLRRDLKSPDGWLLVIVSLLNAFGQEFAYKSRDHIIHPGIALMFMIWLAWSVATSEGRARLAGPTILDCDPNQLTAAQVQ